MLRTWREDFARLMREQGIAANATPRAIRGQHKGKTRDPIYRAHKRRGQSTFVLQHAKEVVTHIKLKVPLKDSGPTAPN
jgi:hypothetical protein